MKKLKRVLSVLLVMVLVITSVNLTVFADDTGEEQTEMPSTTATGTVTGEPKYTLVTGNIELGKKYLIVNSSSGSGYALAQTSGQTDIWSVAVSNQEILVTDDTSIAWTIEESDGSYTLKAPSGSYLGTSGNNNLSLSDNSTGWNITPQTNGGYQIKTTTDKYLYYSSSSRRWRTSSSSQNVYLFEEDGSESEEVKFAFKDDSMKVNPGAGEYEIPYTITYADEMKADYSDITWTTSDKRIATVVDGFVEAGGIGTVTITAELSSVDGRDLESPITIAIPVTVTYDGLTEAESYPEYPADGAVRVNKTATESGYNFKTKGVTHVELDVAGISQKTGVDVVLVVDVSNSMAWNIEKLDAGYGNGTDSLPDKEKGEDSKLDLAMEAATDFADILLAENNKSTSDNSISFVTFAGYDEETEEAENTSDYRANKYADAVKTVFTGETDLAKAKTAFDNTSLTYSNNDYYLTIGDRNGNFATQGTNHGNTNYDYAFRETVNAVNQIKSSYNDMTGEEYDDSSRELYVVFMTDGAPTHYEGYCSADNDGDLFYKGTDEHYKTITGGNTSYVCDSTKYSRTDPSLWMEYIHNTQNTAAVAVYEALGGKNFYTVGFDLAHGGFGSLQWDEEELGEVLQTMLQGDETYQNVELPVALAENEEELVTFYKSLATQIELAGNYAQVTDVIGSEFTLQTTTQVSDGSEGTGNVELETPPTITITYYDLFTKADITRTDDEGKEYITVDGKEYNANELLGTRKGTKEELEIVSFNNDGTEAYSSVIGKDENIMTINEDTEEVTIEAYYFTYTKVKNKDDTYTETFIWDIGDITDKEIALEYDVYLSGSYDSEDRPYGLYATNAYAYLEYVDINGKYARQDFPVPQKSWGNAVTRVYYYLVNEKGQPVNHMGEVVPDANRVYLSTQVIELEELEWNETHTIRALDYVKDEKYYLYDTNAYYTVTPVADSKNPNKGIVISDPSDDAKKTYKDEDGNSYTLTGAQTTVMISANEEYYTSSVVAFGVLYNDTIKTVDAAMEKDQVVIDYGKAIQIDVLANDAEAIKTIQTVKNKTYETELVGFRDYGSNINTLVIQTDPGKESYTSANGEYKIEKVSDSDGNEKKVVQFQLTNMLSEVDKVFCVIKLTETENPNNYIYLYEELDIIPATSVYYETDFAENVFEFKQDTSATSWQNVAKDGSAKTGFGSTELQDDGTVGNGQTYGYDSSYDDDAYLSNGSSYFVEGAGNKVTTAQFKFTGTGFDLISRTGEKQGAIRVDIYSDAERTNSVKRVSVINKSDTELELYQIPVISVEGLDYGTYYVTIGVDDKFMSPIFSYGNEFYFDAIRIYNPAQGNTEAEAAYAADGEANPDIREVRNILIAANDFNVTEDEDGVVFVDKNPDGEKGVEIATYQTIGPNNEVYLSKNQAIAFKIGINSVENLASIDIGAKSVNEGDAKLNVSISNTVDGISGASYSKSIDIKSATAQYYEIRGTGQELTDGVAYVVISNTGDGVLSITDIKFAYNSTDSNIGSPMITVGEETVIYAYVVANNNSSDTTEIKDVSWDKPTYTVGETATMTVETSIDVEQLTIEGSSNAFTVSNIQCNLETLEDNSVCLVWTVEMSMISSEKTKVTITGYNKNAAESKKEVTIGVSESEDGE